MIYNFTTKEYNNPDKIYVEVVAVFSPQGEIMPKELIWHDGQRFEMQNAKKIGRTASRKAGGVGIMYEFWVLGKQKFIFLEETRWFMERKTH